MAAQILKISSAFSPPPPEGFISPMAWGVETHVQERFGKAGIPAERVTFQRDSYTFRYEGKTAEFVSLFKTYYGPTMNAFEAAAKNGREEELGRELVQLFETQNQGDPTRGTEIPATFLRATVSV